MIKNWISRLWSWRNRLCAVAFVGGLAILLCDWSVGHSGQGRIYAGTQQVPERPIALVLGTGKYAASGQENLFYKPRIRAAAELYHAGKVRALLVSGDNSRPDYDEPTQMKEDLIALGVPGEHISCDYAGFSTLDSVVRAGKVFQETSYVVISQEFHVRRALFLAKNQGHDAVGLAVAMPQGYWGRKVRLREVLARVKAVADVHIFRTAPTYLGSLEVVAKRASGA
jgi:SanA protein